MYSHNKFITSSISEILKDAIYSTRLIGNKMELSPLVDYMMQSTFIKMCGFQEQKMKCIMWELASDDFTFRYEFLSGIKPYPKVNSAYSNYDDKNKVYSLLIKQIGNIAQNFEIKDYFNQKNGDKTLKTTFIEANDVNEIIKNSSLYYSLSKEYEDFNSILKKDFIITQFGTDNHNLLSDKLKKIYEILYKNRNRIAHNTKSYQHNLPTFSSLRDENYIYENYFVWFALLVLIDDIFIELYKKYLETLDQRKFL